jgi:hypothetical protein
VIKAVDVGQAVVGHEGLNLNAMRVAVGGAACARSGFGIKIGVRDAVEVATYNGVLVKKIRLAVKIVNVESSFGRVGIEVNRREPRSRGDSFDLRH